MANGQYICEGDGYEACLTWRDGNRLCVGYTSKYTIRDETRICNEDSYDTQWTIRDNGSHIACCSGDSNTTDYSLRDGKYVYFGDGFETAYTVRNNQSCFTICKGDSHESLYTIREGVLKPVELFAVLGALQLIAKTTN